MVGCVLGQLKPSGFSILSCEKSQCRIPWAFSYKPCNSQSERDMSKSEIIKKIGDFILAYEYDHMM